MKVLIAVSMLTLFVATAATAVPTSFAEEYRVTNAEGSSTPGCEANNECFVPASLTINVGDMVIWDNVDNAAHTITSGVLAEGGPDGIFDSGLVSPGTEFSHTFDDEGTFPYFCLVHPWMSGEVAVMAAGGSMEDDEMMMDGDMISLEEASAISMLEDTEVRIRATEPTVADQMVIDVMFVDSEHVNYDIMIAQEGAILLDDMGVHTHTGMATHMTEHLDSDSPVDIIITFQGYGIDEKTGPIGVQLEFAQVVPEFGTLVAMILAIAVVSVVVFSARSRLSIIPRY